MIFATVGTQLPFERLVRSLDNWAAAHPHIEVFAQIGKGSYEPGHLRWKQTLDPREFRDRVAQCSIVVAHAGMGSIISAIELGKRVIVMPRRAALGEHRNEHQLATAARLQHIDGLEVIHDEEALAAALGRDASPRSAAAPVLASSGLIAEIRRFAGLAA